MQHRVHLSFLTVAENVWGSFFCVQRAGVKFPERASESTVPLFSPPHQPQAIVTGYPVGSESAGLTPVVTDNTTVPEGVPGMSLTDIATAHSIIEILTDMLSALDPQDEAVMFRLLSFLLLLLWACLCFDSRDNNLQCRIILPSPLFFSHGFTILCLLVKIKPDMLSWGQWFYCELLSWS
jgi:hypothetical protein